MMLPQETIDKIKADADKYGFVVPYNGSKSFYLEDKVKGYQAGATEWAGKAQDDAFIRGYACCVACIIKGHGISTEVNEAFNAGIGSLQRCVDANCDEYDIEILKKHFK
jgi:hypothetical protein